MLEQRINLRPLGCGKNLWLESIIVSWHCWENLWLESIIIS